MSIINIKEKLIQIKIVFYGPGRSGKTSNLVYIYDRLQERFKDQLGSKLITINTKGDRTLFFDFFPVDLGKVQGMDLRIQLYTTPGQIIYESTRRIVLNGVDGIVFVADSLAVRRQANIESLECLKKELTTYNRRLEDIPIVFQWNKRDLAEEGLSLLDYSTLQSDLNDQLKSPAFPSSATKGENVFETLKIAARITLKSFLQKIETKSL